MKLIFRKPWGMIGCQAFPKGTSIDVLREWLLANHKDTIAYVIKPT